MRRPQRLGGCSRPSFSALFARSLYTEIVDCWEDFGSKTWDEQFYMTELYILKASIDAYHESSSEPLAGTSSTRRGRKYACEVEVVAIWSLGRAADDLVPIVAHLRG